MCERINFMSLFLHYGTASMNLYVMLYIYLFVYITLPQITYMFSLHMFYICLLAL